MNHKAVYLIHIRVANALKRTAALFEIALSGVVAMKSQ
jgi:hypothetical protein